MDLSFGVEEVTTHEVSEDGKSVTLKGINIPVFMEGVFKDEKVEEFLNHPDVLNMFAKKIGVAGLLRAYDKEEVCEEMTWEFIREYFMDHIDEEEILEHIGFETCKDHFKDHFESSEDINSDEPSLLETTDGSEG